MELCQLYDISNCQAAHFLTLVSALHCLKVLAMHTPCAGSNTVFL
jgi:hypothetical protein